MTVVERFDVIVVGSGGGLIGAYAAGRRGLRTLVVEKDPWVGGTTAYSGAGIWLPGNPAIARAGIDDDPAAAAAYLDDLVGDDAPAELRQAYLQAGPEVIAELEADPWFGQFEWRSIPEYYDRSPGFSRQGRTVFPADLDRTAMGDDESLVRPPLWTERWGVAPGPTMAGGQALIGRALKAALGTGNVTVRTSTPFTDLVVEDGRVVGVVVDDAGTATRIEATRGVLLAAGGFEHDEGLRRELQPHVPFGWSSGAPGNTGDALRAAQQIGADTDLLDEAWFAPGVVTPHGGPVFYTMVWSGIWVNSHGERFMNERLPYDRAGHELLRCNGQGGASTLPTHWVFDQRQVDANAFEFLPVDPPVPGWFDVDRWCEAGALVRADTLEELAGAIGVPAGALVASVEEFNQCAREGRDTRFGRGDAPWDRVVANVVRPHTDGPNKTLGVIDRAPYYAAKVVVTDLGTKGGLRTDARARVLRTDGAPIEGLYASGNTMAPALGRVYPGAGGPIGSAMVFSWLAAVDMAQVVPSAEPPASS